MSRRMLLLSVAVAAAAQQTEPVYRSGAQLVEVDVVVHNDKGPVKDLTKDDFTLQDKGKPQAIAVFAMNEKGGDDGKATPLPAGVQLESRHRKRQDRPVGDRAISLRPHKYSGNAKQRGCRKERKPGRAARF